MRPLPLRARRPRPVVWVWPQWAGLRAVLTWGRREREWPVQACRALRWAMIQSTRPSRWTTTRLVLGDLGARRAV